ncbi:MAG: hypothetical protein ABRQ27_08400 [Clostridiaceae bacterium]
MFKLGSYLMFTTLIQLIAAILYTESMPGVGVEYTLYNIHPLIFLIILLELVFSGYLMYTGYPKFKKME